MSTESEIKALLTIREQIDSIRDSEESDPEDVEEEALASAHRLYDETNVLLALLYDRDKRQQSMKGSDS